MKHEKIVRLGLTVYYAEKFPAELDEDLVRKIITAVVLAEREACVEEALYEKRMAEERLAGMRDRHWHLEERHLAEVRGQIQAAFWVAKHIRERGNK